MALPLRDAREPEKDHQDRVSRRTRTSRSGRGRLLDADSPNQTLAELAHAERLRQRLALATGSKAPRSAAPVTESGRARDRRRRADRGHATPVGVWQEPRRGLRPGEARRRRAGPWTKTSLRRVWKSACDASGVEISLYEGTKYSRATDLLRQGVSERVLQALLGHRDARPTRRYARLSDEALVDAIRLRRGSSVNPAKKRIKKKLSNQVVMLEAPGIEPACGA